MLKYVPKQSDIDRVFHALGDPTRRAMVETLGSGPASVSALAKPLGISLAAVVQHLQVLEESGLVTTEKVGRVRSCRLEPKGFRVAEQWIADRKSLIERKFDRLEALLSEEPTPPSGDEP
ncbi:helix-turn-helix transcriptional regulator [Myxococcus xanthus]|uniref:Helix-turn-helix transcriptional regulator n=1 Tax=Myxococcus xanthus TaxID=34 RepID=A0A7Y4ILB3_MYXXA|nr:helix-turn-helix transcriptional regulator [Myxococcus xanthus]NOJ85825.1 helix-turn-helix transcriptional regulator [Myxococcus xanthus]